MRLAREKRARAGSRNGQKKVQVNENIKKSGPLITGEGGSRLVLNIVLILARQSYQYKVYPPIPKDELILFPAKHFLFGSELTLWDSLYKGMTGIKGLLFYCIHLLAFLQLLDYLYSTHPTISLDH